MAASTIGVVQVVLSARDDSLTREMRRASSEVENFHKSFQKTAQLIQGIAGAAAFKTVVDQFQQMREEAVAFAATGVEAFDALGRQASNLGVTSNAMAAFLVMERRADMASGSLASALAKMQQEIQGAGKAGSETSSVFWRLGVDVKEIIGLNAADQFKIISDGIAGISDHGERAAITMDIFGKSGKELVATISEGSAAFIEASKQAENWGLILSKAQEAQVKFVVIQKENNDIIIKGLQQQAAAALAADTAASQAMERAAAEIEAKEAQKLEHKISIWNRETAFLKDLARSIFSGDQSSPYARAIQESNEAYFKATQEAKAHAAATEKVAEAAKAAELAMAQQREETRQNAAAMKQAAAIAVSTSNLFNGIKYAGYLLDAKQAEEQAKDDARQTARWFKQESELFFSEKPVKFDFSIGAFAIDYSAIRRQAEDIKKQRDISNALGNALAPTFGVMTPEEKSRAVMNAENDPRVIYEREVLRAIQDGKTEAEARAKAEEETQYQTGDLAASDIRALKEKRVQQIITDTQEQAAKTRLQQEREALQIQLGAFGDFFGNLATLTEDAAKSSREMFYVNKAMQIAQAEINAWMAFSAIIGNQMLNQTVGPAMTNVMAATALAAGQMAVAKIAAAQPAGRANGGPVSRGVLYRVNERGPELLTMGDKAYLMMGNQGGSVAPHSSIRPAPTTVVHVHNNADGTRARVEHGGTDDAPTIDVIIDQVDRAVAAGIRSGAGASARAIEGTYGVSRSRGAR